MFTGSSKHLLEEEKFRKNGKKKYEALAEKLTLTGASLVQLAAQSNSVGGIEVTIDFSSLSQQAQGLLRGKNMVYREKLELMHLHTMTHGTRRWSDDAADGAENVDPVTVDVILPPAPPANAAKTSRAVASKSALPRPATKAQPMKEATNMTHKKETKHDPLKKSAAVSSTAPAAAINPFKSAVVEETHASV